MNPSKLVAYNTDKFDVFNPKVTMDYKLITPQDNCNKCKYVCHAGLYNDMGHATSYFNWETEKPHNYIQYEKNIRELIYRYSDNFIKDEFIKPDGAKYHIRVFRTKNKNKWLNILRLYLNNDTFVRMDFNKV